MLYNIIWYFTIYSFLGWILEVGAHVVTDGKFINRGFLNGPVCPIYGFGVVIVLILLEPIAHNVFLLFFGSMLVTSVLEFVTGFALEKIFKTRWWDYSKEKFNIMGYVSLRYSLLFGAACVVVVRLIHPLIAGLVNIIPYAVGVVAIIFIITAFIADLIVMVVTLNKINANVKLSREISEKMKEASEKLGQGITDEMFALEEKVEASKKHNSRLEKRICSAYPALRHLNREYLFKDIKCSRNR